MAQIYRFGDIEVDLARFQIARAGHKIDVEPKAMDLIALLIRHEHRLVTKTEILDALWPDASVTENSLTRLIAQLRKALGDDAGTPKYIATVPTRGYRFVGTLLPDPAETPVAAEIPPPPASGPSIVPPPPPPPRRRQLPVLATAVVLLAAVVALIAYGSRLPYRRASPVKSLAVLAMKNLTGNADQEYFADGLTDQLITDLAQLGSLRVISRTSAMSYRGTTKTIPVIAQELNVDAIIESSLQRSGDRVRVVVQLIDGATDEHIWAQTYERPVGDSLALESDVARSIADQVHLALTPERLRALTSTHGMDPQAQEAYLRGRAMWRQGDEASLQKAIEWFNSAIAKDPNDPRSWAGLADAYVLLADFYQPAREVMPKARDAADRALALDDRLAAAHVARGVVRFLYDWDWAAADAEFQRAIALEPGSSEAHGWRAVLLAQLGRIDEALLEIQTAESVDPISPAVYQNAGWIYYLARQEDRALAEWKKALEIDPALRAAHTSIWLGFLRGSALKSLMPSLTARGAGDADFSELATLAGLYATQGERKQAEATLARMEGQARTGWICPYELATANAALNNTDKAIAYLQQAVKERSSCMPDVKMDPRLDAIRNDPRFIDILRAMAFPATAAR